MVLKSKFWNYYGLGSRILREDNSFFKSKSRVSLPNIRGREGSTYFLHVKDKKYFRMGGDSANDWLKTSATAYNYNSLYRIVLFISRNYKNHLVFVYEHWAQKLWVVACKNCLLLINQTDIHNCQKVFIVRLLGSTLLRIGQKLF